VVSIYEIVDDRRCQPCHAGAFLPVRDQWASARNKISEISSWQSVELKISNPRNFMHIEWSEEKFLKGSVGHQMKLCF